MNAIAIAPNKSAAQVKDNNTYKESVEQQLRQKLQAHYKSNLFRSRLKHIKNADADQKGKYNFASNNYLGLANNQAIINQLQKLLPQLGVGSGASNLITGYHHIHQDLERTLAKLLNCEQAILFSSGYMANLSISDVLLTLNKNTLALHDHNNHASLLDGTRLADCKLVRFKHNNIDHLTLLLNKHTDYQNKFIFTESLFSMDGDFAPLEELSSLSQQATLIVDHSHGFGLFDSTIKQSLKTLDNKIIMGTFGKAIGASGAFVAGSKLFIESLIQFARPYIYTTSLSPVSAAASLLALKLINQDDSYKDKLFSNIEYFCQELRKIGIIAANKQSPIQPIIIGDSKDCIRAAEYLNKNNIIVTAIRAPTVPRNQARLRITLSAQHNKDNIDYLIKILKNLINDLNLNLINP